MEGMIVQPTSRSRIATLASVLQRYALIPNEPPGEGPPASLAAEGLLARAFQGAVISGEQLVLMSRVLFTWNQQPLIVRETATRILEILRNQERRVGFPSPQGGHIRRGVQQSTPGWFNGGYPDCWVDRR